MMTRDALIRAFLEEAGWGAARRRPLAGDASTRRYERLDGPQGRAVLMDAPPASDGPPIKSVASSEAKPYSAIAHLAEDCRPFVAIGRLLRGWHLSAPVILAHDMENGLLLLEDLGDALYGRAIDEGQGPQGEPLEGLYRAAIDVLLAVHARGTPGPQTLPDGSLYVIPAYDDAALAAETALLTDWYLPAKRGGAIGDAACSDYRALWAALFPQTRTTAPVLTLRDFHSPNLLWLPERQGAARVGLIDFQDAVIGPRAYDLVSLLQDARRDVPQDREQAMLVYYITEAARADATFDETAFRAAYAILGAQRNAKIAGIFVRLWQRDGKPGYLAHIPRVLDYLERDLAHPVLAGLKDWLDAQVSPDERRVPPGPE